MKMSRSSGVRRLLYSIGMLLLLGGILLTAWLDYSMPGLDDYAAQSSEGLVILFTDEQSPRLANRLLAAGLAEHGLGIAVIPGRSLNTDSPDQLQNISLQVNNLLRETGLGGHQVLYAGTSTTAGALLRLTAKSASLPQPRGILLLEPDLMRLDPSEFAPSLPAELATAIFASVDPASASSAADLFLWLSGEDASLFPGFSSNKPAAAQTWLSLNGNHRLVLMENISGVTTSWSPRLRAVTVQAAAEMLASGPEAQLTVRNRLTTSTALIYNRTLTALLALLLLAAAPLVLIIARQTQPAAVAAIETRTPGLNPWISLLLYLPAAALALPLGDLLAKTAADLQLSANFRFYALIGIYGWLHVLAYLLMHGVGRSGSNSSGSGSSQRVGSDFSSESSPRIDNNSNSDSDSSQRGDNNFGYSGKATLLGGWLAVFLLGALVYWLFVLTGKLLPPTTLRLIFLIDLPLVLLLAPAMLPYVVAQPTAKWLPSALAALGRGLLPLLFLFGLRLLDNPAAPLQALAATAAAAVILFSASSLARAVYLPGSRITVPLVAGLLLILLLRPYLVF
ncbi:MAG: hypothetical protein GX749_05900 [Ruminococcaceae bacterium]|nr:hypothetical protein [Oscillospiraceae bacterium]